MLDRRGFIKTSGLTVGALALGPAYWRAALADTPVTVGPGPYGALGAPNAMGVAVPSGFTVRIVAAANEPVGTTPPYPFPIFPDGSATFPRMDGGWTLVSNSEVPGGQGGCSAIDFGPTGAILGGRRILGGTSGNCAGGTTPQGAWLSCEEVDAGFVFACDPMGDASDAVRLDAMGVFKHEAACVDDGGERVYLTEDTGDSGLYRFTPDDYPDYRTGTLEIATGTVPSGQSTLVVWEAVPDPTAATTPTRDQVPGTMRFRRGEGIFFDTGIVYIATTSDDRVYAYDTMTERIEVLYDGKTLENAPLHQVDNLTTHVLSGDLFVAEDADDLQICVLTGDRVVAPFAQLSGGLHEGSEMTGVTFNPAGNRMYFASQRGSRTPTFPGSPGAGAGLVFEVSGPFRTLSPRETPVRSAMPTAAGGSGTPMTTAPGDGGASSAPASGPATSAPGTTAAPGAAATPTARRSPFALRARPASRLSTVERQGLPVSVDVQAGSVTVRLRAGGTTLAIGRARPTRSGRLRLTLRPTKAAARFRRGRFVATLELRQGSRRVTRPLRLVTPGRPAKR